MSVPRGGDTVLLCKQVRLLVMKRSWIRYWTMGGMSMHSVKAKI